ncbi:MAG: hypothetical protein BWY73_00839 [candidate division TA06 bacterium ADurb.Bin417]|uniref:Uncharacterized protein n=1 Tax=candidate division TA06 bacterium ADurb.Bin417 TaxID=1852828 RepID=A0A1V5MGQ0_UNCT6|nr:MAG: hypothetical protein BWY73_00839 [candidate division TA06 bacterium ADurb.Bin417]
MLRSGVVVADGGMDRPARSGRRLQVDPPLLLVGAPFDQVAGVDEEGRLEPIGLRGQLQEAAEIVEVPAGRILLGGRIAELAVGKVDKEVIRPALLPGRQARVKGGPLQVRGVGNRHHRAEIVTQRLGQVNLDPVGIETDQLVGAAVVQFITAHHRRLSIPLEEIGAGTGQVEDDRVAVDQVKQLRDRRNILAAVLAQTRRIRTEDDRPVRTGQGGQLLLQLLDQGLAAVGLEKTPGRQQEEMLTLDLQVLVIPIE